MKAEEWGRRGIPLLLIRSACSPAMRDDGVPTAKELVNPVFQAIKELGGSGANAEIVARVAQNLDLPDEFVEVPHLGSHTKTELAYQCAWAQTKLKNAALIINAKRGVWELTRRGREVPRITQDSLEQLTPLAKGMESTMNGGADGATGDANGVETEARWQEQVIEKIQQLAPEAFERLCRRLLRESGFADVEVTARGKDGGIDGQGHVRLAGLLTIPIVFQSKRYRDAVGSQVIRDFRGAMAGRANHGLILTTGRFTRDAVEEATRIGQFPIDLVDGTAFAEKLREYELGLTSHARVEYDVEVDPPWFESI